jgi:hypothetical protein
MTRRRRYCTDAFRLAAALAVLLFVVFAPFLVGGKSLMTSSADVTSIYPTGASPKPRPDGTDGAFANVQRTYDYSPAWLNEPSIGLQHLLVFEQHVLPMWDPYEAFGTPFAASMQPQPFFPPQLVVAAHPNVVLYDWYLVFRLFVAALGTALFVRLFAGFAPALAAGATSAFGSYYMIYYDMGHLSVETLFPALLLSVELNVRRVSASRVALLSAVVAGTFLGGMPESALLSGGVAAAYALVRLVSLRRTPRELLRRLGALAAGAALGTAMSAIMLLPFMEYLPFAFDVHQSRNTGGAIVGLQADSCLPGCLPTWISPIAYGPPWNYLLTNFQGPNFTSGGATLIAIWLACTAVLASLRALVMRRAAALDTATLFFAAVSVYFEAKRFGAGAVQWTGTLPLMKLVVFQKYGEALVTAALAILVGFGIRALVRAIARGRVYALADLAAAALVTAAYTIGAGHVPPGLPHAGYFYGAVGFGAAVCAAAAAARALARAGTLTVRRMTAVVVALVVVQAAGSYAIPIFYFAAPMPPAADDPFVRPAFLGALAGGVADGYRVHATQATFHANWPGAFGVGELASNNAMYPSTYIAFVRAFVRDPLVLDLNGTTLDLAAPLTERFLRLASVRYVVAPRGTDVPTAGALAVALWERNKHLTEHAPGMLNLQTDTVASRTEQALFEHPPQRDVTLDVDVPAGGASLIADAAIMPHAYLDHECAAPVRFTLDAEGSGAPPAASLVLDPKRVARDRRWVPLRLDLSRLAGRRATLRFATAPVKPGDLCNAWAEWGNPRLVRRGGGPPSHWSRVLSEPLTVLRFADPLPRATVFRDVRAVAADDLALTQLTAPAFDDKRTALVAPQPGRAVPSFAPCSGGDRLRPHFERADRVVIDATLACDGLVMLNDTWFPGWHASMDGVDVPIWRTDVVFRGVAVRAGAHTIVFAYDSRAVRTGLIVSLAGLVLWVALLVAVAAGVVRRARLSARS